MTLVAYKKVCNRDSINYLLANLIEQIRHIKLFAPSLNITREKIYIHFLFTSLYSVSKTDMEISMMGFFLQKIEIYILHLRYILSVCKQIN